MDVYRKYFKKFENEILPHHSMWISEQFLKLPNVLNLRPNIRSKRLL